MRLSLMRAVAASIVGASALTVLLAGCAPSPERAGRPADRGEPVLEPPGDMATPEQAARRWLALAASAGPPRSARLRLRAARAWLKAGDPQPAAAALSAIDRRGLSSDLALDVDLLAARTALQRQRPDEALALLTQPAARIPDKRRREWHTLLARAHAARGENYPAALQYFSLADWTANAQYRRDSRAAGFELLQAIPISQLERLLQEREIPDAARGWLELAHGLKSAAFHGRPLGNALAAWRLQHSHHPAAGALGDELVQRLRADYPRPGQVAVMLPFGGRMASFASALRDGILAAYFQASHRRPEIRIYNVGERPDDAIGTYLQAVQDGADWVIGPLRPRAVTAVMQAEVLRTPLLALNYPDRALDPPPRTYQLGLDPSEDARQVAARARRAGHRQALTLTPNTSWGRRLRRAFERTFEETGGRVIDATTYGDEPTMYGGTIAHLLHIEQSRQRHRRLEELLGRDLTFQPQRRQDVDMLFMAARPPAARQLRPQLQFHRAGELPVYATSHVYSGQPQPQADQDLDGVRFCEAPWLIPGVSTSPPRSVLSEVFPDADRAAARLHALGVDAYRILPFLAWLAEHPGDRFPGVTGELSLTARGRVLRGLSWAEFRNGVPVPLEQPALPIEPMAQSLTQSMAQSVAKTGNE